MEASHRGMGMKILDTSVLIDHLRGHLPATECINALDDKEATVSVITEAEILSGESCNDPLVRESVAQLLARWERLEVSHDITLQTGNIKRKYRLALPDALIAATAFIHKMEVLTKNIKDFSKVEGLVVKAPY